MELTQYLLLQGWAYDKLDYSNYLVSIIGPCVSLSSKQDCVNFRILLILLRELYYHFTEATKEIACKFGATAGATWPTKRKAGEENRGKLILNALDPAMPKARANFDFLIM